MCTMAYEALTNVTSSMCSSHPCVVVGLQQRAVTAAGAVTALLPMLSSPRRSSQEACMEALAALSADADACEQILQDASVLDQLLQLSKQRAPQMRYLCSACITNLSLAAGPDHICSHVSMQSCRTAALAWGAQHLSWRGCRCWKQQSSA